MDRFTRSRSGLRGSGTERHLGYELLKVLLHPRGNFVDYDFHKAYHLKSFLNHISPLAAGAFGCYSVLITLPVFFFKK